MQLALTIDILRAAYELLAATEPFIRWNLPESEDVKFVVVKDRLNYAWHFSHRRRAHKIAVSRHAVGTLPSLLETLAHELIHIHITCAGIRDTSEHGVAFKKFADAVCKVHQFDRKRF